MTKLFTQKMHYPQNFLLQKHAVTRKFIFGIIIVSRIFERCKRWNLLSSMFRNSYPSSLRWDVELSTQNKKHPAEGIRKVLFDILDLP